MSKKDFIFPLQNLFLHNRGLCQWRRLGRAWEKTFYGIFQTYMKNIGGKGRDGKLRKLSKPKLILLLKTRHPPPKQRYASVLQFYPVLFPFAPIWMKTYFNPILYFPSEATVEGLQLKLLWLYLWVILPRKPFWACDKAILVKKHVLPLCLRHN